MVRSKSPGIRCSLAPSRGRFALCRDIFLNNREAVLEILQRFNEDLTALQRATRWGEGDKLRELFTRTRAIRRSIIEAKQA
jgi:cyclohexadieny/prephenate dehydrogenase